MFIVFKVEITGCHPIFQGISVIRCLWLVTGVLGQSRFGFRQRSLFGGLDHDDCARILCGFVIRAWIFRKKSAHCFEGGGIIASQVIKHSQVVNIFAFHLPRYQHRRVTTSKITLLLPYFFRNTRVEWHLSLFEFSKSVRDVLVRIFEKLLGAARIRRISRLLSRWFSRICRLGRRRIADPSRLGLRGCAEREKHCQC